MSYGAARMHEYIVNQGVSIHLLNFTRVMRHHRFCER
jgi:hypothetical protein